MSENNQAPAHHSTLSSNEIGAACLSPAGSAPHSHLLASCFISPPQLGHLSIPKFLLANGLNHLSATAEPQEKSE
jgi:hypothetical protein